MKNHVQVNTKKDHVCEPPLGKQEMYTQNSTKSTVAHFYKINTHKGKLF